jgi:hypothetical protein
MLTPWPHLTLHFHGDHLLGLQGVGDGVGAGVGAGVGDKVGDGVGLGVGDAVGMSTQPVAPVSPAVNRPVVHCLHLWNTCLS